MPPSTISSGYIPDLGPKPPPIGGVMTRTPPGGEYTCVRTPCSMCGICDVAHCTRRPPSVQATAAERTSIGQAARRWLTRRCETTTSQPSNRSSVAAGIPIIVESMHVFVPASGKRTTSSRSASSTATTTGSGSYVDDHELGRVLALPRLLGDHHRERLADVADDVECERALREPRVER